LSQCLRKKGPWQIESRGSCATQRLSVLPGICGHFLYPGCSLMPARINRDTRRG